MARTNIARSKDGNTITLEDAFANSYDATQYGIRVLNDDLDYTTLIDYDSGTNPIYIGKAATGTLTSAATWQIMKITWDVNNNPTEIKWADSVITFTKEWDERASYTYG